MNSKHALIALSCLFLASVGARAQSDGETTSQPTPESPWPPSEVAGIDWADRIKNPVTQPTLFESATIQSEIRPIFIHQQLPQSVVGGDFQVYALQARAKLTDRLALLATKDGIIDLNADGLPGDSGGADLAGGLKYAVIQEEDFLLTPGFTFELPIGNRSVLQGNGDGVFRPFLSTAWEPTDKLDVIGNIGWSIPVDEDDESSSVDYHLHLGYQLTDTFMPLIEFNGISYTDSGKGALVGLEGGDLINLGSAGVAGRDYLTGAIGGRFKLSDRVDLGAAYGFPLGDPQGLFDYRVTIDMTIRW
jgi:hypothetical protein